MEGTNLRPKIRKARIKPKAKREVPNTDQKEVPPVNINPERKEICIAINKSSNMIMPMMTSVSGFAVRFKSVSTLATIAVDELVIKPQSTIISLNGRFINHPINKPETKLRKTYKVPPVTIDFPDLSRRLTENSNPKYKRRNRTPSRPIKSIQGLLSEKVKKAHTLSTL